MSTFVKSLDTLPVSGTRYQRKLNTQCATNPFMHPVTVITVAFVIVASTTIIVSISVRYAMNLSNQTKRESDTRIRLNATTIMQLVCGTAKYSDSEERSG